MIARYLDIAVELLTTTGVPSDRLPYTESFEEIYARFNEIAGVELSRHEVWWYLVGARKRGLGRATRRRRPLANT